MRSAGTALHTTHHQPPRAGPSTEQPLHHSLPVPPAPLCLCLCQLAGRFTARTLRSLVVATSGSSLPPDALERELMRREEAAADLVPPAAA